MFKSSVQYILIVIVAILAYVYLGEFFVYFGQPVYVNSVFGTVRGRVSKARGGREIYSFTIPYGKPPTVDEGLRFQVVDTCIRSDTLHTFLYIIINP